MRFIKKLYLFFILNLFTLCVYAKDGEIPKEWQEQYPISDYVEVFESQRSKEELFNSVRAFLLLNYGEFLDNTNNSNINSEMIVFKIEESSYLKPGSVPEMAPLHYTAFSFDVIIEFKANRMRLSCKNVHILIYGYALRPKEQTQEYGWHNLKCRQIAYGEYQKFKLHLIENLQKIADGSTPGELDDSW